MFGISGFILWIPFGILTKEIIVANVAAPDNASEIPSSITLIWSFMSGSVNLYSSLTSSKVFSIISFVLSTTSGNTAIAASLSFAIMLSFSPPLTAIIRIPTFWNTFNKIRPKIQFALAPHLIISIPEWPPAKSDNLSSIIFALIGSVL